MPRDDHFLSRLDRVKQDHLELALRLYRDPDLVRSLIASAKVPESVERVALSLAHPERGPFVILTRDGHFVTCLAEGMCIGNHFVIRRDQLDAMAGYVADLRARLEVSESLITEKQINQLMARIVLAGDTLSREEYRAISLWKYFYWNELFRRLQEDNIMLNNHAMLRAHTIKRPDKASEAGLFETWKAVWSQGHMALLLGRDEPEGVPDPVADQVPDEPRHVLLLTTTRLSHSCAAIRGAFAVGTVGAPLLDHYRERFIHWGDRVDLVESVLALVAIANRHWELRDKVRKILHTPFDASRPGVEDRTNAYRGVVDTIDRVLDDPKVMDDIERDNVQAAFQACASLSERARKRYARPEDIPIEDAGVIALMKPFPVLGGLEELSRAILLTHWAARRRPEELYPTGALLEELKPRWCVEKGASLIEGWQRSYRKKQPRRATQRPGPNEPCSCGSGMKYKKCCGRPGQQAS